MHEIGKSIIVAISTAVVVFLISVMAINRFASMEFGEGSLPLVCIFAAFGGTTSFVISYRRFAFGRNNR